MVGLRVLIKSHSFVSRFVVHYLSHNSLRPIRSHYSARHLSSTGPPSLLNSSTSPKPCATPRWSPIRPLRRAEPPHTSRGASFKARSTRHNNASRTSPHHVFVFRSHLIDPALQAPRPRLSCGTPNMRSAQLAGHRCQHSSLWTLRPCSVHLFMLALSRAATAPASNNVTRSSLYARSAVAVYCSVASLEMWSCGAKCEDGVANVQICPSETTKACVADWAGNSLVTVHGTSNFEAALLDVKAWMLPTPWGM